MGLASAGAGIVFALLLDALPAPMVSVCSGALLGFGLTCLLRQWGRFYRSFTFQGALLNTGLSFLLSSLWWFAMVHAGTPFLFCLGLIVLVLSGGLPLLASDIVRADEVRAGLRDREERWVPYVSIWQVMRQGWAAVVGLMFNFFVIGLTFCRWPRAWAPALCRSPWRTCWWPWWYGASPCGCASPKAACWRRSTAWRSPWRRP